MNREGAKNAKEDQEENAFLPSRSLRLRGLIIPMQPDLVLFVICYWLLTGSQALPGDENR
jgi:hypothetical protein